MQKYLLILITIISTKSLAQDNSAQIQGFYDLSRYEINAGIYFMENATFFYYTTYRNDDVKMFGTYEVSNDMIITVIPNKKLMNDLQVFGRIGKTFTDSISVMFQKPYKNPVKNLVVESGNSLVPVPSFSEGSNQVSISLAKPSADSLIIQYQKSETKGMQYSQTVQLNDSIDALKISRNYHAELVNDFAKSSFKYSKDQLIFKDLEPRVKKRIDKTKVQELITNIKRRKNNSFVQNKQVYKELY